MIARLKEINSIPGDANRLHNLRLPAVEMDNLPSTAAQSPRFRLFRSA